MASSASDRQLLLVSALRAWVERRRCRLADQGAGIGNLPGWATATASWAFGRDREMWFVGDACL